MWPELEHLEASNFYMPQVIDRAIKQCALTCFALIYWNCIVSCLFLLVNTCLPQEWTCYFQLKNMLQLTSMLFFKGCRIVFGFFLASGFGFFWFSFPVPFALYLQPFGTRTCHFAWYLPHFGMATLHFAWRLLHLAMFAFHSAWYVWYFGISTSDLHGICYILVLQPFMWVSWGFFRLSSRVSFKASFKGFRLHVGFHLGFFRASFKASLRVSCRILLKASFGVSFRVSFRVSLGFHKGFLYGFI